VKRIQRAELEVQGGFIVGLDSDTPTIFARQIKFIQQSGIVTAMAGLRSSLPQDLLGAGPLRAKPLRHSTVGPQARARPPRRKPDS
jgi:hypothetical protein